MFQDATLLGSGVDEFKSSWRKQEWVTEGSSQTSEILTYEAASQSRRKKNAGVQTEPDTANTQQLIINNNDNNTQGLLEFLRAVTPQVLAAIDDNIQSHAFDNYTVDWSEIVESMSNTLILSHTVLLETDHTTTDETLIQVTAVSWNSSGSVVSAGYGHHDHIDWCTHKGCVCLWNVDRVRVDCKKADTVLECDSCVMCVTFHPVRPALIAGGTFNGKVLVWDLSHDGDDPLLCSTFGEDSHRESINELCWAVNTDTHKQSSNNHTLMTASSDGHILMWRLHIHNKSLTLLKVFTLSTDDVRRMSPSARIAVSCLSFSYEDHSVFIAGSESGRMFKCCITQNNQPLIDTQQFSQPITSPVNFHFSPHHGPVYSIHCHPFQRHLFVSGGSDSATHLYNMLHYEPVMSIQCSESGYVFCCRWSPHRPTVLAVGTSEGRLCLYDLRQSIVKPHTTLQVSDTPIHTVSFNIKHRNLIATGHSTGHIHIWQLSDQLCVEQPGDRDVLDSIASD